MRAAARLPWSAPPHSELVGAPRVGWGLTAGLAPLVFLLIVNSPRSLKYKKGGLPLGEPLRRCVFPNRCQRASEPADSALRIRGEQVCRQCTITERLRHWSQRLREVHNRSVSGSSQTNDARWHKFGISRAAFKTSFWGPASIHAMRQNQQAAELAASPACPPQCRITSGPPAFRAQRAVRSCRDERPSLNR